MQNVRADTAVSVSELKKNPTAVLSRAGGNAVALLNHSRVMGYVVPAELFEGMLDRLEDLELAEVARARAGEKPVKVRLDEL
jgi:antitoxin StbD